ncbi:MAG: hypothetical protein HFG33_00300 [Bacilli bacterium]|nr:hypothetical protein [Bacilli bacterium]
MEFDAHQTYCLASLYYKRYEGKEVTPSIGYGKVINTKKTASTPAPVTVHYELQETIKTDKGEKCLRHVISEEEFLKALSTILEDNGFQVDDISLKASGKPKVFAGIEVSGKIKEKENTKGK